MQNWVPGWARDGTWGLGASLSCQIDRDLTIWWTSTWNRWERCAWRTTCIDLIYLVGEMTHRSSIRRGFTGSDKSSEISYRYWICYWTSGWNRWKWTMTRIPLIDFNCFLGVSETSHWFRKLLGAGSWELENINGMICVWILLKSKLNRWEGCMAKSTLPAIWLTFGGQVDTPFINRFTFPRTSKQGFDYYIWSQNPFQIHLGCVDLKNCEQNPWPWCPWHASVPWTWVTFWEMSYLRSIPHGFTGSEKHTENHWRCANL